MEWAIAHLKNWRILATRYRSDLSRIDTDIQAVAGLQKLNEAHAEPGGLCETLSEEVETDRGAE